MPVNCTKVMSSRKIKKFVLFGFDSFGYTIVWIEVGNEIYNWIERWILARHIKLQSLSQEAVSPVELK